MQNIIISPAAHINTSTSGQTTILFSMGCVCWSETPDENDQFFLQQRMISDAIDRSLVTKDKSDANRVRMILLGAGESGKLTVLKQMKILHLQLFTNFERRQYADVIWLDLLELMKKLIFNARKLHIPLDCDQPGSRLGKFKRVVVDSRGLAGEDGSGLLNNTFSIAYQRKARLRLRVEPFEDADGGVGLESPEKSEKQYTRPEIAEAIVTLWQQDPGIRRCFDKSNLFQLESLMAYFFDKAVDFSDPNYLCTDHDIIMGRIKTTGITEHDFAIRNMTFKVMDAGGQRLERKKWIHCFQDIDAVVFVLAVSEYDETLYEDNKVNRMEELFALFEALCNSRWFRNTPFILFLNKVDLLSEKLPRSPIKEYLPEYSGDPLDALAVIDFMEKGLLAMNKTQKPVYVHRTCATDTKAMRFVLSAVTDMLIQLNLKQSGIM